MKIVILANRPRGALFRLGAHHIAEGLEAIGHQVMYVPTPVSEVEVRLLRGRMTARNPFRGLEPFEQAITTTTGSVVEAPVRPVLPVRWSPKQRRIREHLRRVHWESADFAIIDNLWLANALDSFRGRVVYRPVDRTLGARAEGFERQIIGRSVGVVATSRPLLTELRQRSWRGPSWVIENGVSEIFLKDPLPSPKDRDGILYVGALDDRLDWAFLESLARAFPRERITVAGPGEVPVSAPNIRPVGPVRYEQTVMLMRRHRVGLLPFNDHPANATRSPMKYYEYLATGLSVVGRRTAELHGRESGSVSLYSTAGEGIGHVRDALKMHSESTARTARTEAETGRWSLKIREFETALLELAHGREIS